MTTPTWLQPYEQYRQYRLLDARVTVNGSHQRTLQTRYSTLGNITSKTSTRSGDDDVTGYTYGVRYSGCADTPGPHAVSRAYINGLRNDICYNRNGYITQYRTASGDDKFVKYNSQGQPTMITVGDLLFDVTPTAVDTFKYGPNGQRNIVAQT